MCAEKFEESYLLQDVWVLRDCSDYAAPATN